MKSSGNGSPKLIRPALREDNPVVASIIRQVMAEFGAVGCNYSISDPEVAAMYEAYPALEAARKAGYKQCYPETLEQMEQARRLYRKYGFETIDRPMGSTGHSGCNWWMVKEL